MSDILAKLRDVERLRGNTYSSAEALGMIVRAADEIGRLREALKEIAETRLIAARQMQYIARRALEQKTDAE